MKKRSFFLCKVLFFLLIGVSLSLFGSTGMAEEAPGAPGATHVWTSARKMGVGTSYGKKSKVWFSLVEGIISEVYWPQIDMAQITDLQFLITDGTSFFDEEKKDTSHKVEYLDDKALAYKLTSTDKDGKYTIVKEIVTDPERDTLIQHVTFDAKVAGLKVYILLNPGVSNTGLYDYGEATPDALYAWDDRAKFASQNPLIGQYQALISSIPFSKVSAGFVGSSDGWQDISSDFHMDWSYSGASNGNVALTVELALPAGSGKKEFDLVIGFGNDKGSAKAAAEASLNKGYKKIKKEYITGWKDYCKKIIDLSAQSGDAGKLYYTSAMVLKAHEDKTFDGGMIASLTVPWGTSQSDISSSDERGILPGSGPDGYKDGPVGYHVVWPRDLYQVATAFIAAGDYETAASALQYLKTIQFGYDAGNWSSCSVFPKVGSFPQNCWLSGIPHWGGLQMDETAMPIILAWRLWKENKINAADYYASFIKPAAEFISHYGPWTQQERWEENAGCSPSTIAAEIAALVCAADFAQISNDPGAAQWYLKKADEWASSIESWTFTSNGPHGNGKYYERIDGASGCGSSWNPNDDIRFWVGNGGGSRLEKEVIGGGFLELVRFGIKAADDYHIGETIGEYDQVIKVNTPKGPGFYRYNFDGYGETPDGADYTGAGKGRLWPLLTGERGHYELSLGNALAVDNYIHTMEGFANEGRMLPEQVWDQHTGKYQPGEGTGSATPLAWSHAEYIRLLRSKKEGMVYDTPQVVKDRYLSDCETVIRVHYDVGWGNFIAIRGDKSPLSWEMGKQAHWTPGNIWEYKALGLKGPFEFKSLINDYQWEQGDNHKGEACKMNDVYPTF